MRRRIQGRFGILHGRRGHVSLQAAELALVKRGKGGGSCIKVTHSGKKLALTLIDLGSKCFG
jgi:hypothetical protein